MHCLATDETPDNTYQDASFYNSLTKHSLSEGLVFTDTIPVTVKTLASLHDGEELPKDIGLVKIDTEGFDLEVIKGMGNYRYPVEQVLSTELFHATMKKRGIKLDRTGRIGSTTPILTLRPLVKIKNCC